MSSDLAIVRNPKLSPSQDYELLRAAGLAHIEQLGHRLWTDYNIHDPGITILELVSYAITELGYRLEYPFEDILTRDTADGPRNISDFHTALQILTSNPVTFYDLRKLLVDIRGVRNAWVVRNRDSVHCLDRDQARLTACAGGETDSDQITLNGLYDVLIDQEDFVADHRVRVGVPDDGAGPGQYVAAGNRGIRFDVARPVTLTAVYVYAETAGDVTVRVTNADLEELDSATVTVADDEAETKLRVPLRFDLEPGAGYRLDAVGTAVKLHRTQGVGFAGLGEPGVIDLVSGVQGDTDAAPYFFFYDWEIDYVPFGPVRVGVRDDGSGPGRYITVGNRGIRFDVTRPLTLAAVHVYAEEAGSVTVRLIDDAAGELASTALDVTEPQAGTKVRVPVGFAIEPGTGYRLDAVGTEVRLHRTQGIDYGEVDEPGLIDLVSGVQGDTDAAPYFFFYDWEIEPAGNGVVTRRSVDAAVLDRIHRYRNLAEDVVAVHEVAHEEIALCADLELQPSADVEAVLAQVFARLAEHVSPPVRFHTIDELRGLGRSTEEIFQGPILDHGFIDDEDFRRQQRRCEIRASDVLDLIMEVEGVQWVKNLELLSYGTDGVRRDHWLLPLDEDPRLTPIFTWKRSKVVLFKSGLPYYPNQTRLAELVQAATSTDAFTKLEGHDRDLPVPVGSDRHLAAYYPVQNELPTTYLVGTQGVPTQAGDVRIAQARQLKAYLMFFEQLLANFMAQLEHIPDLFSWQDLPNDTYFTQAVDGIREVGEVYDATALDGLVESESNASRRRRRLLDHLIARFGEDFTEYSLLMYARDESDNGDRVIADQRRFLSTYPRSSRERATAYDYRWGRLDGSDNLTGYQRRVYGLLGITPDMRRRFAGSRFRFEEGPDGWRFLLDGTPGGEALFESKACRSRLAAEALLDTAFHWGSDAANYEPLEPVTGHELVQRDLSGRSCGAIGATTAADARDEVVAYFADLAEAEGFHVVEHLLLRPRSAADPYLPVQLADGRQCVEVVDPYSFHVSVVLPSWPRRFEDVQFRRFAERTLRVEAPAHVFLRVCWVNHAQMHAFEDAYEAWSLSLPGSQDTAPPGTPGQYADRLARLIDDLHGLVNVYPLARLHDHRTLGGDAPAITLDNTSLGTF